mmetsp:Transcript_15271/g.34633  ORF Transcript_15271/g.34633 Transcript_15271/m.34633 type:complete len:304 (-) Transcript_15271:34-945(-)
MRLPAVGCNEVHHQGAAVRGGNKEQHDHDDGDSGEELTHAVVLVHEVEPEACAVPPREEADRGEVGVRHVRALLGILPRQAARHVEALPRFRRPVHRGLVEEVARAVEKRPAHAGEELCLAVHADGRGAKGAEPDQGIEERHREDVGNNVANGAAPGDARQEGAHKGRPGDPPAPVKDGPPVHPCGSGTLAVVGCALSFGELRKGIREEANLDEVLDVVPEALHHHVQQVPGRVQEEDRAQQEVTQEEGRLRHGLDAVVEAGHHGERGAQGDDDDAEGARVGDAVRIQVRVQPLQALHAGDDL